MARGRRRSTHSVLTAGGHGSRRRRRGGPSFGGGGSGGGRRIPWWRIGAVVVLAALVAGGLYWRAQVQARDDRHAAALRFVKAWERLDHAAMWRALTPAARAATSESAFVADYRRAEDAAGVKSVSTGVVGEERGGSVRFRAVVALRDFGALRARIVLPVSGSGDAAGVDWKPELRLPGLRRGEAVRTRAGDPPQRANVLAADGTRLNATALGASLAGVAEPAPTGLERIYDERLGGRRSASLRFGDRTVVKIDGKKGRSIHTTIKLALTRAAQNALGSKLGGIAVIKPSDGSVLALAGLAVSAPQPPGSSFKIITAAAALQEGVAKVSSSYPVRQSATLSGVKLRNASDEQCGGSLTSSFAHSCNSVFGPIGAKLGAKKLVSYAERFGFNETPALPAAKPSSIPKAADLKDSLAVGASAIGQNKDLATPLGMASVGATIANGGVRIQPWVTGARPARKRAVSAKVAAQVRDMMIAVVQGGTGSAAAIPGVQVAGKTGTAELVSTADIAQNAKNTTAWFVAFAPAKNPRVAVAVMLPGAGQGGASAAPIAKRVLRAAL
jgi:peptidoglycan glycosyltransferase